VFALLVILTNANTWQKWEAMTATQTADLAGQLAALWGSTPSPMAVASSPKLPPLLEPLRCEFDHGDPANWKYALDRYGRKGWRRVACKGCGEFFGYQQTSVDNRR
jgi:hypothetical protein